MEGSEIREQIKRIVTETLQEMQIVNGTFPVMAGIVLSVNADGTLNVGAGGILFESISSPRSDIVQGQQVIVLSVTGVTIVL